MPVSCDVQPLLERAHLIGLRSKHICDLTGIPPTSMSRAKTGAQHLSRQEYLDVRNLLIECEELASRNTLPVNWTDLRVVRRQLEMLRQEKTVPPEWNAEDFRFLSQTTSSSRDAMARSLDLTIAELNERIEAASARIERLINYLGRERRELETRKILEQIEQIAL